ncbi:MAG: cyclic nucleotide-binding domain-containing protein [Proteobacteria bacterium]|nr:cyclic nucleotide-binding domain-containing protein [Pseudomonadota bacterium]
MDDIKKAIRQIEFFRDFSDDEAERLLNCSQWVKFGLGQTIISEGGDDQYLYILVRGQVNVVKNRKVLAQINAGDSFGEISSLARSPRTAHVIARKECFCLRLEPFRIDSLPVEIQLKLVKKLLYTLADRLISINRRYVVT